MTAQDIYETALAFLYEYKDKDKDYKAFFLPFLNTLLAECFPYENSIREAAGREALATIPLIADISATVPYDDAITRIALPYGIASIYFQDEGDNYKAQDYRNRYISALSDVRKAVSTPIEDVY